MHVDILIHILLHAYMCIHMYDCIHMSHPCMHASSLGPSRVLYGSGFDHASFIEIGFKGVEREDCGSRRGLGFRV